MRALSSTIGNRMPDPNGMRPSAEPTSLVCGNIKELAQQADQKAAAAGRAGLDAMGLSMATIVIAAVVLVRLSSRGS